MSGFFAILVWLLIIEIAGVFSWPIIFALLPSFRDRGFLLSKILGVLLLGFGIFWAVSLTIIPFRFLTVLTMLILLGLVGGVIFYFCKREFASFWKERKAVIWRAELFFLGAFFIFLLIRSLNPEIYWGEKPMDFTLLNSILRSEHMPPYEAWYAGTTLNYYYLGSFLLAVIAKLGQIAPGCAYNLGVATVMSLFFVGSYSLILAASKRVWAGILGAMAVAIMANLEMFELLWQGRVLDFGFFWDTTRIIPNTVNEYPFWTFLFGDLHAHFIAFPFMILTLSLLYQLIEFLKQKAKLAAVLALSLVLAIVLGSLFPINFWNWPTAAFLTIVFLALAGFSLNVKIFRKLSLSFFGLFLSIFIVGLSYVFWAPFHLFFRANTNINYGLEIYGMQDLRQFLGLWATFVIPLAVLFARDFWQKAFRRFSVTSAVGLFFIILPLIFVILNSFFPICPPFRNPASSLLLVLIFFSVFSFVTALSGKERANLIFAKGLLAFALLLLLLVQFYMFADKMNTIFKTYIQVWILFAVGGSIWFFDYFFEKSVDVAKIFKIIFASLTGILFIGGLFSALVMIFINSSTTHVPVDRAKLTRPALDGTKYLAVKNPDEAKAIRWINENIKGAPVILEAQKISYADYTRISMNTGLPTVLGWEYHVLQRGVPQRELEQRKIDIETMYTTRNIAKLQELLQKYKIEYIYVGKLEKETYTGLDVEMFEKVGKIVFENETVKIFQVRRF